MKHQNSLKWFLKTALTYLGTPYIWGGDDPSGYDCSGFVLECLKTVGICCEQDDFTADSLLRHFSHKTTLSSPEQGALLFFLDNNGKAFHVVICLDEYYQIGASGGNISTKNSQNAWNQNAYIKIRPIPSKLQKIKLVHVLY